MEGGSNVWVSAYDHSIPGGVTGVIVIPFSLGGGGGTLSRFKVTEMWTWAQKSIPQKSLGLPEKLSKIPWTKINLKKFHAEVLNLKNTQKGLNDITSLVILHLQHYEALRMATILCIV